jgi:uncharacterized zinc-type alcohol dehydrogenase-like protein
MKITAYAAKSQGQPLEKFDYESEPLKNDEVSVAVEYSGLCHSDLSMIDNEWGVSQYPLVPGHEVIGKIVEVGANVHHLKVGQRVGVGWYSRSCLTCYQCLSGNHNLCLSAEATIIGRHGGFATHVRCQETWAMPLPEDLDPRTSGPLFCGGITAFNPIIINRVLPIHRVGVIGIGGLGHMAIRFLKAWGCEVTAFSTSPDKQAEAKSLGAHKFLATKNEDELKQVANYFDMILVTVNVPLNWDAYIATLRPGGKLHLVGAAPSVQATVFPLIGGAKSIGASPLGSPSTLMNMLEFCGRHEIGPVTEHFMMSDVNAALDRLKSGKARYRIILENDLSA